MKKILVPTIIISVLWFVMDFIVHGNVLIGLYIESASLWRPMEDMSLGLNIAFLLTYCGLFVGIYDQLVANKSAKAGLKYGVLIGAIVGVSMASSVTYQPIPQALAVSWLVAMILESAIAGYVLGKIFK